MGRFRRWTAEAPDHSPSILCSTHHSSYACRSCSHFQGTNKLSRLDTAGDSVVFALSETMSRPNTGCHSGVRPATSSALRHDSRSAAATAGRLRAYAAGAPALVEL